MDDGKRLWLIDYEYSGNNDPCFELGNIWSEAAPDARPPRAPGRRATSARRRRCRPPGPGCSALMAKYGWTLWASIQASVSDVDFDFWAWGLEKYDRARTEFARPAARRT